MEDGPTPKSVSRLERQAESFARWSFSGRGERSCTCAHRVRAERAREPAVPPGPVQKPKPAAPPRATGPPNAVTAAWHSEKVPAHAQLFAAGRSGPPEGPGGST